MIKNTIRWISNDLMENLGVVGKRDKNLNFRIFLNYFALIYCKLI